MTDFPEDAEGRPQVDWHAAANANLEIAVRYRRERDEALAKLTQMGQPTEEADWLS